MSVDFTAKIVIGYIVTQDELTALYNLLNDDEAYDMIRDEYLMLISPYNNDSDLVFVVGEKCSTNSYKEIPDTFFIETKDYKEKCTIFHKYFNRENEEPKWYLIQEVW